MAKSPGAAAPTNRLLARLPAKESQRLVLLMKTVPLDFKQVLYEARTPIDYVYFPNQGVVSAIAVTQSGNQIEVATIGNEGMLGLLVMLGDEESPNRMLVQVPGQGLRMEVKKFRAEASRDGSFRRLLVRYHTAYLHQLTQSVACNGLHNVHQRCCRWVLMTHDRVESDEFPLTHEFLSHMLGVRRVSVTDVLKPLQAAGLLRNHRGQVTVLNRRGLEEASCECYQNVRDEFERLLGPGAKLSGGSGGVDGNGRARDGSVRRPR